MWRRSITLLLSVAMLALAGAKAPAADPPKVSVVTPVVREVADHEDFTGRLEAAESVDVKARVTGYLDKVGFKPGDTVKKGDLLFQIDPRVYEAELKKAEADIKVAEARLKARATDAERAKALFAQKAISREEFDRAVSDLALAEAEVRVAQAQGEMARANLESTAIRARISGRVGRALVSEGNLVKEGETVLATVVSVDPIRVAFDVDERTVLRLGEKIRGDGKPPAKPLPVQVGVGDGRDFPLTGQVDFVDNRLDPKTGTLRVVAALPNKDGKLLPGMFARVRLVTGSPRKVLLVPERAVGSTRGERFVYVVNDKNVVERRAIQVGATHDGLREVREGLTAEDRVIVEALERVEPGKVVTPEKAPPAREPGPKPE